MARVQAFISKVFADADLRKRLAAEPDVVLSEHGLSEEEQEAVRRVGLKYGFATGVGTLEAQSLPRQEWLGPVGKA